MISKNILWYCYCIYTRSNLASILLQLYALGIDDVMKFDFMNKPSIEVIDPLFRRLLHFWCAIWCLMLLSFLLMYVLDFAKVNWTIRNAWCYRQLYIICWWLSYLCTWQDNGCLPCRSSYVKISNSSSLKWLLVSVPLYCHLSFLLALPFLLISLCITDFREEVLSIISMLSVDTVFVSNKSKVSLISRAVCWDLI